MTALPEFNDYLVFADEAEGYSWLYCTDLGGRKNGRHSRESGNPRTRFHQRPLPRSGKTPQELIGSFYGVLMLRIKRPLKKAGALDSRFRGNDEPLFGLSNQRRRKNERTPSFPRSLSPTGFPCPECAVALLCENNSFVVPVKP